jgi:phosphatidylserine/phosphatidylglycerophosphate/cardiolipin synthase-like enzyme
MKDYLIWLAFVAVLIAASAVIQLKSSRYRHLQGGNQKMLERLRALENELREKERRLDDLQRSSANLLKWRSRASELEQELRTIKGTQEYASIKRAENLERYIASSPGNQGAVFLATFTPRGRRTFEEKLDQMLESAEYEVIIVSPWIKAQIWNRIKGPIKRFARKGGSLRVFIRGCQSDFASGQSDDIRRDVEELGGELIFINQLHAKLYAVDKREAIVASANLTKGGIEGNYEAGIWINNPKVMKDINAFIDDLYSLK